MVDHLHATVHPELADRRRAGPLAVVLVGVDDFKAINDDFGHASGDAVLREVAALLSQRGRGYRTGDAALYDAKAAGRDQVVLSPRGH